MIGENVVGIKGLKMDWDRFTKLRKGWQRRGERVFFCPEHQTYFVVDDEPCWQCYNSCLKEE